MIVFPAIDLKEGQCVRLIQGDKKKATVYAIDPAAVARSFQAKGAQWIHVVDLDGAFAGQSQNTEAIAAIAASVSIPFQVGGGLRSEADVSRVLELGASRVVIGTKALAGPEFMAGLLKRFGPERIVLGLDTRDGLVAADGWTTTAAVRATDLARLMADLGVMRAIFTDISRDGMLSGPNLDATAALASQSGLKIIASGGVTSLLDLEQLKATPGVEGAVIGKALYDGRLDLAAALRAVGA